jgi:hypothetical protein
LPKWLRDVLASLSLANLCLLSSWLILLNPNHYVYYFWKNDPGVTEFVSLIVLVLVLASVFWLLHRVVNKRIARLGFLLVLTWPINSFLIDYANISFVDNALKSGWKLSALLLVGAVLLILCWRYQKQLVAAALSILIVLSPFIVVNVVVVAALRHKHPPISQQQSKVERISGAGPRVIWIIFDELQTQSVFENRPSNLVLPEFDRFAGEALNFTDAYPPSWQTLTSLPALISGQLVKTAVPVNENELELTSEDGAIQSWSTRSSVFSEARKEGFSSSLAGWYHPYCRVIGKDVDNCYWTPQVSESNPALDHLTFARGLQHNLTASLLRIPLFFRLFHNAYESKQRHDHASALSEITSNANKILAERTNLTLIHFSVPHSPWIHATTVRPASIDGYLENVKIADQVLGELRRTLAADWDEIVVLISSDHWWRHAASTTGRRDHRIPFMLKLAGQKQSVEYKGSFNTVLTRELVLQLLRSEIKKPSEVVEWLEQKSRLGESSLTVNAP